MTTAMNKCYTNNTYNKIYSVPLPYALSNNKIEPGYELRLLYNFAQEVIDLSKNARAMMI